MTTQSEPGPGATPHPDPLKAVIEHFLAYRMNDGHSRDAAVCNLGKWILLASAPPEEIRAELQYLLDRRGAEEIGAGPVLIGLDTILPEEVSWACQGWLPRGKLTLLSGDPKLGKSFLMLSFASAISTGSYWPNENGVPTTKGSVILLSAEDDAADTIVPRLETLGADLSKIKLLRGVRKGAGGPEVPLLLDEDLQHLETAIKDTGDAVMVGIDPMLAFTGGIDTYKTSEVRGLLSKVCAIAARHEVAFLGVNHLTKSQGGPAIYRPLGSLAFAAAARMILTLAKDKDNPARRLLIREGNLTPAGAPGRAFSIVQDPQANRPTIAFEPADITVTADDALASDDSEAGNSGERSQARTFLKAALEDGPVPSKELIDAAKENGISERTRRRAEEDLGIASKKIGTKWFKALPGQDVQPVQSPSEATFVHLGHLHSSTPPPSPSNHQEKKKEGGQGGQGGQDGLSRKVDTSKVADPTPREDGQEDQGGQDVLARGTATFPGDEGVAGKPREGGEPSLFPEAPSFHDDGTEVGRRG